MFGVFTAFAAEFREDYFFGDIDFVSRLDVVLTFTHRTDESKDLTVAFFSHGEILT